MASLDAMKLPGVGMTANGEAALGRVLRSHATKASLSSQPNPKLVDAKITYKAKKKKTAEIVDPEKSKPTGKREAVRESVVEESTVAVVKQGKKPRKTVSTKTELVTKRTEVADDGVTTKVVESWTVSLSTAGALAEATKHLVAADEKLKRIIEAHGSAPVWEHKGSSFSALARAIVYQQLAGKAASTIYGRLIDLCGGPEGMTPTVIAGLSAEELRAVGISGRKSTYLHDLADKFSSGFLTDEKLAVMSEDDLVTALTAVKGIGVWSAHMFMIFHLHKPDVLPVGDLGIRKGFQKLFQLKEQPSAVEMQELALLWRPYRTLASWYLWRLSDMKLPEA